MLERLRQAVVPPRKEKFVVIRCSAMVKIRVPPTDSDLQNNNSSFSVPHDKFSLHEDVNHLCRMLFPGGGPTTLAHSSFGEPSVEETRRNTSLVFLSKKREELVAD